MNRRIIILKKVFDADRLLRFRKLVFEWGQSVPPEKHGVSLPDITDKNFHRIDDDPTKSKVPHIYHALLFNHPSELEPPLKTEAFEILNMTRIFQNQITGNSAEFSPTSNPIKLRPQIQHYPVGGGFFGRHIHPLEPQKIGIILGLSRRLIDYNIGATEFELSGHVVSIEEYHDIGDIALFRYDVPHCVTPIDENEEIDWGSERGRWTLILPYHR